MWMLDIGQCTFRGFVFSASIVVISLKAISRQNQECMQRSETEAIRTQSQSSKPNLEITKITNSQNTISHLAYHQSDMHTISHLLQLILYPHTPALKSGEHIGFGLAVRACIRLSVQNVFKSMVLNFHISK